MFGCRNALIAHSRDPRQIRLHPHRLAVGEFRSIQKARKRCNMRILPKPEKHPTSFLAPLGKPSLHKNADVSGNTRLALPHHLRYLPDRSEEHTSELQSLMRISYAVFCLKKKKQLHTASQSLTNDSPL